MLVFRQAADAVFHDDDGAIHDDAEVERAETHQVAADFVSDHAGDGEKHGQGNDRRRDQRGTDVTKRQAKDDNHEDRAFD